MLTLAEMSRFIRTERMKQEMSMTELAKAVGLQMSVLYVVEDETRDNSYETIRKVLEALGYSLVINYNRVSYEATPEFIGHRAEKLCSMNRITYKGLAERSGFGEQTIYRIVQGRAGKYSTVYAVMAALNEDIKLRKEKKPKTDKKSDLIDLQMREIAKRGWTYTEYDIWRQTGVAPVRRSDKGATVIGSNLIGAGSHGSTRAVGIGVKL